MKLEIVNKLTRTAHRAKFKVQKHSPEILMIAGAVGVVASAVMACKATRKLDGILEENKKHVDDIHEALENKELIESGRYTEEDARKDLIITYRDTTIDLVKLYGPSVILGGLSLTCMFASHYILRKRNIALAAAYATIDKGFKEYRKRVIDRFGERIDYELKHNIKAEEIETTVVNEDGTETTAKSVQDVIQGPSDQYSEFARMFDVGNPNWTKNAELNLVFLRQQERFANEKLRSQGFLFLNDIYDMLGIPKTKAGQIVGWVYDPKDQNSDSYVDFGIYNVYSQPAADFVNGYERSIILDFNVDGNILDRM